MKKFTPITVSAKAGGDVSEPVLIKKQTPSSPVTDKLSANRLGHRYDVDWSIVDGNLEHLEATTGRFESIESGGRRCFRQTRSWGMQHCDDSSDVAREDCTEDSACS